jgi:cell division protein FtsX
MQGVRSAQKEMGKKLDALTAIANEKKEVQRIEAISDVVKNDKAFKTIAVVTSCLTFVAIVFAVLLALYWKK